jgi:predicted secreted hydrolase
MRAPNAPVVQGDGGYSRKGPLPEQASYYYSRPQLAVSGQLTLAAPARQHQVNGVGWLDHEWSSQLLDPRARGWDWVGLNLDDGSALMAFRIRGVDGAAIWAGGSLRDAAGVQRTFRPGEIRFEPLRQWTSPRTRIAFPVAMRVTAGEWVLDLAPLLDDQELDSRLSTGAIYWEGAVAASRSGRSVGRGYLELTGYGERLLL